jgi:fermentation-respiration switch protein FrsA (DUF1100 family)
MTATRPVTPATTMFGHEDGGEVVTSYKDAPTRTVANGESDRMVPTSNSVDLAQRLPNAELVVYPDAGHGGIFQFHEQFVDKGLEFLGKVMTPRNQP